MVPVRHPDEKNCQVAVRVRPLSRVESLQNPSFSVEWDCEVSFSLLQRLYNTCVITVYEMNVNISKIHL